MTRKQLAARGLSAAGLQPVAWLYYDRRNHRECALFDPAEARPKRALSVAQADALARGRGLAGTGFCGSGLTERAREESQPCGRRVPQGQLTEGRPRGVCRACRDRIDREVEEGFARAAERDHDEAVGWAAGVLADESAVVVDTETTGLDPGSRVVSLCVLHVASEAVLLDTWVNPGVSIPVESTAIHGIGDGDVVEAPRFGEVAPLLRRLLWGKRVVGWNVGFDRGMLDGELLRAGVAGELSTWCRKVECAMTWHAAWAGEWDEEGEYVPWPLRGPHSAVGDCRTVVTRLREMAAG